MSRRKKGWISLFLLIILMGGVYFFFGGAFSPFEVENPSQLLKSRVLVHPLNGIIMESDSWIQKVAPVVQKRFIRSVVFVVDSPGGTVGASQELSLFLSKIRKEWGKPVVVYSPQLLASGAYYMALGADEIITAPGALVGSIGVIMNFLNLEGVYDWARIRRFSLTTGKFKDSGADWRPMRDDEKELFQGILQDVHDQFTSMVQERRGLSSEELQTLTDGRVMTGKQAKESKLIDEVGTLDLAIQRASRLAGYSEDLEPYRIPESSFRWKDFLLSQDRPSGRVILEGFERIFRTHLVGRPLYLYPGIMNLKEPVFHDHSN